VSTGEVRGGRVRPVGVVGGQKVTGKVAVGLSDGRGGQGRGWLGEDDEQCMGMGVCTSSTMRECALGKSVAQTQYEHFVLVLKSSSSEILTSVGSSNVGHAT